MNAYCFHGDYCRGANNQFNQPVSKLTVHNVGFLMFTMSHSVARRPNHFHLNDKEYAMNRNKNDSLKVAFRGSATFAYFDNDL